MKNSDSHIFDPPFGGLRRGSIVSHDLVTNTMKVKLTGTPYYHPDETVDISYPLSFSNQFVDGSPGLFIGALPTEGTPVIVGAEQGTNKYYFVSFLSENIAQIPQLNENELLIYANNYTKLTLDQNDSNIYIGSDSNNVHINSQSNLLANRFQDIHSLTQASRHFNGIIKREFRTKSQVVAWSLNNKINDDSYDPNYTVVGLDVTVTPNSVTSGADKNPPLVEDRQIIYEFQESSLVKNDLDESATYSKEGLTNYISPEIDRRKSKADTLNLGLVFPNHLIETVKGTVVDIFGNVLDINRFPLPIGQDQNTLKSDISKNLSESYLKIRELYRKSVAFHFEINARKDFKIKNDKSQNLSEIFGFDEVFPDADYGRQRSRFFIDIDKEGQFKLNVPASSEKGNVPILTRYENYSTINSFEEDGVSPDNITYNEELLDILHDSFACPKFNLGDDSASGTYAEEPGSITIKDNGAAIPLQDRRYEGVHIKHGTAYHDILATCYAHSKAPVADSFFKYVLDEKTTTFINDYIPLLKNICSDTIEISGENANAGGRSGSINFDGSIEMNVGANTVDRQSIWLDTAGGMIANIGRDKNSMSAAISMNGNVFMQIGGHGVTGDSRFSKEKNGQVGATLDLRIFDDNLNVTMIRVDNNGISIFTPGNLNFYSAKDVKITGANMEIDVENLTIQGRAFKKTFGGSA